MNRCAIAGTRCPREATITLHIEHVGERAMCEEHADLIAHSGMLVRVIEPLPRRLARIVASTIKPAGGRSDKYGRGEIGTLRLHERHPTTPATRRPTVSTQT